jgi:hypothetical protein
MKKNNYLKKQLLMTFVSSGCFLMLLVGIVSAWTKPLNPPYPEPGYPIDSAGTVDTGCDCKTASLKKPGFLQVDWPQDSLSQNTLWGWWQNGESWSKSGNATNYNTPRKLGA